MSAPDPPNKCYCKFEKQHFLILADVFKDMSTKCSDPSFSDTLKSSSEVFANMATNCSESRALAPQAQVPQAQAPQQNLESQAASAQAQTGSVVVPTTSENVQRFIDQSISRREQDVIRVNESAATAQKIGAKYQYQDATKAAPQVPAIANDTLITFPNRSTTLTYQTFMTALNNTRTQAQHRNTALYDYLTQIWNKVKDAQSVSDVERVLTEYEQFSNTLTRGTNGYYFSIDAAIAGGTRKRRLKRTLRKRSKRTKKARKRK